MVCKKLGEKVWLKIEQKAKVSLSNVESNHILDDSILYSIVLAASTVSFPAKKHSCFLILTYLCFLCTYKELNVSESEIFEAAGYWFIVFIKSTVKHKLLYYIRLVTNQMMCMELH